MEDTNGDLCSDEEGISNILVDYYQQLFASSNPSMIEEVVAHIPCFVTDELNAELLVDFTKEEVVVALKQNGTFESTWVGWFTSFILSTVLAGRQR